MAKVLVLYYTRQYPMRASQRDFLMAFKRYAHDNECYYVNAFASGLPILFKRRDYDLVILTWSFLGLRFMRNDFRDILERMNFIKDLNCPKVMMPQDEFSHADLLCETIDKLGVNHIFTVCPLDEVKKIYKTVDFNHVSFSRLLTGYLDERLIKHIEKLNTEKKGRKIDIGYRSGSAAYWGRFNLIKFQLAEVFLKNAEEYNLKTDIEFGWENFLLGDDWYRFMLNCRFIPGVEGGSSILDWDGSFVESVQAYLKKNPGASYDEVETHCIPKGKDGEINVVALSPRHLEACLTRTCQVLIEGDYNGILKPGVHYIELKKDFSNLDDVLKQLADEQLRQNITKRAYTDIVESGEYFYSKMTRIVFGFARVDTEKGANNTSKGMNQIGFIAHCILDRLSLTFVYIFSRLRDLRNSIKKT